MRFIMLTEKRLDGTKFLKEAFVKPLRRDILAVAVTRVEGTWRAYIKPVQGIKHEDEWLEVARYGALIEETIARAMFPKLIEMPYYK